MNRVLIISCEHASNKIPDEYIDLFQKQKKILKSHRAWDIGAVTLYNAILQNGIPLYALRAQHSRLLVDLNRSLHHKNLFSEFSKNLPENLKSQLIKKYYFPYRNQLIKKIFEYHQSKIAVIHLSLHSFVPELHGQIRENDIGLLYDPSRIAEKNFCNQFKKVLLTVNPDLTIRMNYPYKGISDGFTVYLRKQVPDKHYAGIEIEMNQKHFDNVGKCKTSLVNNIVKALKVCISN